MLVTVERTANTLLIVTCVVVLGAVGHRLLARPATGDLTGYHVNDQVRGVKADVYEGADKTLLLFVRSGCRFCTASMDFYRKALEAAGSGTRIVAVGPEAPDELRQYFVTNHVRVPDVRTVQLSVALVNATPTLLLVNGKGRIQAMWVGQLPKSDEERVLASLK